MRLPGDKRLRIMWLSLANTKAYLPEFLILLVSFPIYMTSMFFLWKIILANSTITSMSFETLITYYIITYVLAWCIVQRWSVAEFTSEMVRRGNMVIYLTRPLDFRTFLFYNSIGKTLLFFAPVMTAMTFVAGFFLPFKFTADPLMILLFFALAGIAFLFYFCFFLMFAALSFWAEKLHGILYAVDTCIYFFGGVVIPIAFLPAWVQAVASWLPFKYATALPAMALLGKSTILEVLTGMAILAVWTVVFYAISKFAWEKGIARFTGYGV